MVSGNWLLLRRLKRGIQKVRFLLSCNVHKWQRIMSFTGSPSSRRQLSLNRFPSLTDCTVNTDDEDREMGMSPSGFQRARSDSLDDNIDRRAEIFISNFYQRLRMERQVSLELRYAKGDGLQRTRSD